MHSNEISCREIFIKPGGKLEDLAQIAFSKLKSIKEKKIVYIMAGIPDICTRVKSLGYEESYFDYLNTTKLEDIKNMFMNIRNRLESIQCKVVFVPITAMNIRNWNIHRFDIGKTSKLLYFPDIMQAHLNELIKQINKFITMTNELENLVTPFLHTYVYKSSGLKLDIFIQN
ncbi:unnamed protein product [Mytilus edulis]|uniref:Uncharacterized protein n=1 Tax=Mytilus edulis TaxID=6550 RepID=A0A8S3S5M0_MYTED|nr:unnamed protein product [Mytilus edulis]